MIGHRRGEAARRLAGVVAALTLATGIAACGDDDDADTSDTTAPTETTEAADETTTSEATTEPTTTIDDTTDTTAAPSDGGDLEADEEASNVTWTLNATTYRGQEGDRIGFKCSPDGQFGSVWGTGLYTDDSSVCTAAVHAGLITVEDGGRVVIEIAPGANTYDGTEANGVSSSDYGVWGGSYFFPAAGNDPETDPPGGAATVDEL